MSQKVSCTISKLNDPSNAAELIDHAIRECYLQSRPVYIQLPSDNVTKKVEGQRLASPLDLAYEENDPNQEDFVVHDILRRLGSAERPVILVDACAIRHRALEETNAFVVASGFPTFVAPMGKGAVNETLPNYIGVYAGDGSNAGVREIVESSDLVLSIGSVKSDFNTAGFSYHTSTLNTIDFHSKMIKVKYSEYHGLRMHSVLRKVSEKLQPRPGHTVRALQEKPQFEDHRTDLISHQWFWPNISNWVRENDIIITETGTSGYGIWDVRFKRGIQAISQILWGSIGYATAATQGAALAAKELGKSRTILFTGDGSFQLTAQELSTIIRHNLKPIIFIICNKGYTIERFIHGMDAVYNDIAEWKWSDLPVVFGAKPESYRTHRLKTREEVLTILQDKEFANGSCLQLVEVYMGKNDAPRSLQLTASASASNNAKQ